MPICPPPLYFVKYDPCMVPDREVDRVMARIRMAEPFDVIPIHHGISIIPPQPVKHRRTAWSSFVPSKSWKMR